MLSAAPSFSGMESVPSPALIVVRSGLRENIIRMIDLAGDPARLVPHCKTVKSAGVIREMLALGIDRFKCATIAEAELLASCGAGGVLVAYQLVGPAPGRLARLAEEFPGTRFATIVDNPETVRSHADVFDGMDLYVDVDPGMGRTGVAPARADPVCLALHEQPNLRFAGIHAYDGHMHIIDPEARASAVSDAYAEVDRLADRLEARGIGLPEVIAAGTPSFPVHAKHPTRLLSPGTAVLSDWRTLEFPDLPFQPAALVLTRVISRTGPGTMTLDLGHKAIASENGPDRRAKLFEPGSATPLAFEVAVHSEEHLTVRSEEADRFRVGDALLALPYHICPTVALHQEAVVVEDGEIVARWPIEARDRRLTV